MPAVEADVPSIAVLPFDNMSADAEQQYFCEGMAEEITNALADVDELRVASRTSAFLAKANKLDIAEVGKRLNVGAVLEGSVRKARRPPDSRSGRPFRGCSALERRFLVSVLPSDRRGR